MPPPRFLQGPKDNGRVKGKNVSGSVAGKLPVPDLESEMRRLFAVLILTALVVPAFAVGKVTDDPNKPGAAQEAPSADLQADPKLAQKVTYLASKKSVAAIFDELAKSTGVVLKAGRNAGDWQVRDRKMNIFAKDVPLNELMNSMARVMKFKWEISGEPGARSYRLFMDRRSLLDAEAQRARAEQKAEEERARKRQKSLLEYARLGNLTPEEKARMKTESPFMYVVANSGMGGSMATFFGESPGALEAIATGQKFQMNAASLSKAAQDGLVKSMQSMVDFEKRFSGGSGRTLPPDLASNMDTVEVRINHKLEDIRGLAQTDLFLGEIEFRYKGGQLTVPMFDPESGMAKMIGKALITCEETGRTMQDVMQEIGPEMMATVVKDIRKEQGGEPIIEHADDPALSVKIKLTPEGVELPKVEEALAEASQYAVVSDHFGGLGRPLGNAPRGEMELKKALEQIAETYNYNWDRKGNVIELRDRNWFRKRAAQIPDAWLDAWREEYVKTGTIDLDSLAQMAALTQEQVAVNLMGDDVLKNAVGQLYSSRELLRLYGSLDANQRAALFTEAGLDLRSLTPDQWSQAQKTIQARGAGAELTRGSVIVGSRSREDKRLVYLFKQLGSDKEQLGAWTIFTPQYIAPTPSEEPAPAKPADTKPAETKPAEAAKPAEQPKPAAAEAGQ